MINSKHIIVFVCLFGFCLLVSCQKKDNQSQVVDVDELIVCPLLYQGGGSLSDALAFIEVPQDRVERTLSSVSKRGKLPDRQ